MKNLGTLAIVLSVIAVFIASYTFYSSHKKNKVAFIELQRVFNEFEMTKQYKGKLEAVVNARKAIADSLELNLSARSKVLKQNGGKNSNEVDEFLYDKEMYMQKMGQFQEDNVAMKQKYDQEINKQLSQYVKDYGEKNGYQFIYGAEGSGVIMHADASYNVSDDVIAYINKRFNGEAK
jgi:outer membrane protein